MINIKNELEEWLINYITDEINSLEVEDNQEFNNWAKAYPKEATSTIVKMEFSNDWGYDEREAITEDEASNYAHLLIQRIVDSWYL